jgi:hypothetical protein
MSLQRVLFGASILGALGLGAGCTLDFDLQAPGEGGATNQSSSSQATSAQGGASGTAQGGGTATSSQGGASTTDTTTTTSSGGTCTGLCIPPAPTGFSGPIRYLPNSAGTCTGPAELAEPAGLSSAGITAPAATCNACSCTLTDANLCGQLDVELSAQASCTGTPNLALPAGSCVAPGGSMNLKTVGTSQAKAGGASCSTAGGGLASALEPAVYNAPVEACAITTVGTCGGADSCVDPATYCVYKAGKGVACDMSSPYVVARAIGVEITDTRACGSCGCAPTCAGQLAMYLDAGCTTLLAISPPVSSAGPSCTNAAVTASSYRYAPAANGCTSLSGGPQGAATEASPYTLCCTQ